MWQINDATEDHWRFQHSRRAAHVIKRAQNLLFVVTLISGQYDRCTALNTVDIKIKALVMVDGSGHEQVSRKLISYRKLFKEQLQATGRARILGISEMCRGVHHEGVLPHPNYVVQYTRTAFKPQTLLFL